MIANRSDQFEAVFRVPKLFGLGTMVGVWSLLSRTLLSQLRPKIRRLVAVQPPGFPLLSGVGHLLSDLSGRLATLIRGLSTLHAVAGLLLRLPGGKPCVVYVVCNELGVNFY